ncbi:hypothetical protein TNCV_2608991 [Trichonephila clavipes]|nr:hypothetical protein TNCV_2608991 [Trichonephila clavipes]
MEAWPPPHEYGQVISIKTESEFIAKDHTFQTGHTLACRRGQGRRGHVMISNPCSSDDPLCIEGGCLLKAFIRALKVLTRVDSCCFKSKFYRKDLMDKLKIFGMSSRHHIDDFILGRIIGKIEEGRNITDVAREFDIAHSVVSRLWK